MLFSLGDLPRGLGQIFLNDSVPTNAKKIPVSVLRPPLNRLREQLSPLSSYGKHSCLGDDVS